MCVPAGITSGAGGGTVAGADAAAVCGDAGTGAGAGSALDGVGAEAAGEAAGAVAAGCALWSAAGAGCGAVSAAESDFLLQPPANSTVAIAMVSTAGLSRKFFIAVF